MSLLSRLFGGGPPRIDGAKARALVADGAALVDVRTPAEFAGGHVDGAVNVPVDRIGTLPQRVPTDRVVVVYCASGMRSARAASLLENLGYQEVHDLGSLSRW